MTKVVRGSIISRDRLENFQSLGHLYSYPLSALKYEKKLNHRIAEIFSTTAHCPGSPICTKKQKLPDLFEFL